ncbi:sugar ABC transporter substrate-binding protein [Oceanobacillus oncorhynchi subsp. incaldanensis]|uniref:D-allose-binding periplasmic protein n=1 Tax=Oceanobacillus oncorhynchi TaxID=545501 RepID=A0A0A1MT85_9BACI|nr:MULTISPECIES: ABC transporter substrate-binding protein [Oceanobacillus]MCT1902550.1 ABC transporter substrate-binding protein [Oceanobacillus sojae]GIO18916.1 sugar ABC transporter substrate-binding protein [Oceanobacillus oncorhynchi subsp. incaldanensis]CEI82186.1 D-allose-binding periplasmic protein precursor [Oceanobacillus oncorhynchi]
MKKKSFGFLMIAVLMLLLAACGGGNDSGKASEENNADSGNGSEDTEEHYKIGILAPEVTHGWVAAVAYHAEERVKELGDQVDYQIQTSSNAEQMTSQLDDLMTWGADAIVAFPQWEGMEVPIQNAIDSGITVVNFDIAIDVEGVYRVAGDNEDMGIQGANYIVDKIGEEGNVVVLEVPSSGSVSELRTKGFEETMAEIAPDMNLMTYATEFTREDGLADFADILTSVEDIDAVYSIDDETSVGVLQAIQEAGRTDIQVVTGGGGMQEYFEMMPENEDIWIQSALYSPVMVKDAVDIAIDVLNGEDVEEETIIPTTVVDRDNYEEFLDENSPY